ncbi:hypothetical protein E2320_006849, partial [Naja naja]
VQTLTMDLGLNLDTVRPVLGKYRSFVGRCCQKCTSKSWGFFFHKRLASMGFCNAIKITEENTRYRGWLVRRLCHFLTVCEWRICAEMPPNLQERLLHTPRVQAVVSLKDSGDAPGTSLESAEEWMREIRRILGQIQGRLSPFLLRALLASLGGVFLPQGVGQRWDVEGGTLSGAVVASQPLLVFLEEVFSGSQQLSPSGRAWLSLVLSAYYTGAVPDIIIVPPHPDSQSLGHCVVSLPSRLCPSILDCEKVECWPTSFQDVVPLTGVEEQVLLDNLSLHTLSVHILSALLLHMHQEGVFLSQLMQDFVWITDEVLMRNYDVGFSGRVRDVLWHGLSLLRDCVTLYSLSLGDILVVPKKTKAAIRDLGHHSMAVLPVFIQEAIGACSINALLMEVLPHLGSPEQLGNFVLAHEELHNKSVLLVPGDRFMCDTAQKGFTEKFLWKATEDFVDIDGQDEAEKQCFKLESCANLFVFLCGLLGPLLKTLERAVVFLQEQDFPQPECTNRSLASTAVRICKELGVFKEATEDKGPLLHLSETFTAQENQKKLEKFIHQFIY